MGSDRAYVFPVADHPVAAAEASNAGASPQPGAQPPTPSTRNCYHFDHTSNSGPTTASHTAHYAPYTYASRGSRPTDLPKTGTSVSAVEDMSATTAAKRPSKTHVPSACMNCKKAHLACDVSRPCKRCVSLGKVDTCIDIKHKKRGRPKLKDKGNRPYSTHAAADTKTWAQAASTAQYVPSAPPTSSPMGPVAVMPQQQFAANSYVPSPAAPPPQAAQPPPSQQQQYQRQTQLQHQHHQHSQHQLRHHHPHHHQQQQQQQQQQHQQQPPMQASHPYSHHLHPPLPLPPHSHPQPYPQPHVVKTPPWPMHSQPQPQPHVLPTAPAYAPIVSTAGFTDNSQMTMFLTVEEMKCARISEECLGLTGFYPNELMHKPLHEYVSAQDADRLKRLVISLRENMDKFFNAFHAHTSALPSVPFPEPTLTSHELEFQTMAPNQLSLPAHGCPNRIEACDMIGLRQRNGQYDLYNVRMYLGGALGGDLTKKETWSRLYIVALLTRTKPGGSACMATTTATAATTATTAVTTRAGAPYDVVSPGSLQIPTKMDPYHGETLMRPVNYGQPFVDAPSQPFPPRPTQPHHPHHQHPHYYQQQHAQPIPRNGEFVAVHPTTPNVPPPFDPYPSDRHSKPSAHGYPQQHPHHHQHHQHHQHDHEAPLPHGALHQSTTGTSPCCQSPPPFSKYAPVDRVDHCTSPPSAQPSDATTTTTTTTTAPTARISVGALLCN